MPTPRPRFFDLARLKQQLDADSEVSLAKLRQRDANLRSEIPLTKPLPQLLSWLNLVETKQYSNNPAEHLEGLLVFGLIVLGLVLGVVAMVGVLFANQQQPVNLLLFLALFVGLQLAFLIATLIALYIPLSHSALHSPMAWLNPAMWALKRSLRKMSHSMPWQQVPRLTRLLVLRWGQLFSICFNVALLASFWLALLVSDRSFGWSSTLNINNDALFQLFNWLSLPWQWLSESATVTPELIAQTRFQNLQTEYSADQIMAMRSWWPYMFFALFTYGLLPRMILWTVFDTLYRRQLKHTLLHYPGAKLVLDRLNTPLVDTRASTHDDKSNLDNIPSSSAAKRPLGNTWLVNWSGALANLNEQQLRELGIKAINTVEAGLQLDVDEQANNTINQNKPDNVIIAVKSWEPPLAELADFINKLGIDNCLLLLVPLPNKAIRQNEWNDWARFARAQLTKPVQLLRADEGVENDS